VEKCIKGWAVGGFEFSPRTTGIPSSLVVLPPLSLSTLSSSSNFFLRIKRSAQPLPVTSAFIFSHTYKKGFDSRPKNLTLITMKSFASLLAFVLLVTQTTPFVVAVKPDTSWEKKLWYGPVKVPTGLKKCEVPHASDSADDSAAIVNVFQTCNTNSEIVFKKGVKYNAWNPMNWGNLCEFLVHMLMFDFIDFFVASVVISLEGSIHLPNNITDIQNKVTTNPNPPSVSARYL
jgi:hypothetical protein